MIALTVRRASHILFILAIFLAGSTAPVRAADSVWIGKSLSPNWSAAANWENGNVPVGGAEALNQSATVIMQGPDKTSNVENIRNLHIDSLVYPLGAPAFTTEIDQASALGVHVKGLIINGSGVTQTLVVKAGHLEGAFLKFTNNATVVGALHIVNEGGQTGGGGGPNEGGKTYFDWASPSGATASAGTATIDNQAAAVGDLVTTAGTTEFDAHSSGGTATINNFGGGVAAAKAGSTHFNDSSTAGNATINNFSGVAKAGGGTTYFADQATAGSATIHNFGGSTFDAAGHTYFADQTSAGTAHIVNESGWGFTEFFSEANAGSATIVNRGGTSGAPNGGTTSFVGNAPSLSAGNATIDNEAGSGLFAAGGETRFFGGTAANAHIHNHAADGNSESGGRTLFDSGTAGNATITNDGAPVEEFAGVILPQGATSFDNSSRAGTAHIVNNGGTALSGAGGLTSFDKTSSAENATIVNNGGALFAHGGTTIFHGSSDAADSKLIANAGITLSLPRGRSLSGEGGNIVFADNSSGGAAHVQLFGNGRLDISPHTTPGVTIGSLEGNGGVFLGANTLSVGNNNLSSTFAGSIHDGGSKGGTGGGVTKVGAGTVTLLGVNTYTGPTRVTAGTLVVDGSIAASSSTTVTAGALLGGHGFVSTISGAGAVAPGNSPGILTAPQVDPSAGTDFIFEFTQPGSPTYNNAASSGNDLLHLTGSVPFSSPLTAQNQITVDFSSASLSTGEIFRGGFFTDTPTDTAYVKDATFLFLGTGGFSVHFDGFVTEALSDFAGGSIAAGSVLQFVITGYDDSSGGGGVSGGGNPVPDASPSALLLILSLSALSLLGTRTARL